MAIEFLGSCSYFVCKLQSDRNVEAAPVCKEDGGYCEGWKGFRCRLLEERRKILTASQSNEGNNGFKKDDQRPWTSLGATNFT